MTTCEKCGRPRATTHENGRGYCHDVAGIGDEIEALVCEIAADAYQRGRREGMREAIEIAKAEAYLDDDAGEEPCCAYQSWIVWHDVDAEIERRLNDE